MLFADEVKSTSTQREYWFILIYTGIYQSRLLKPFLESKFLSEMKADQLTEWKAKSGKSVNESLHEFILDHVGKPIDRMLRYV